MVLLWASPCRASCSRVASLTCPGVGGLIGLMRDSLTCLALGLMSAGTSARGLSSSG